MFQSKYARPVIGFLLLCVVVVIDYNIVFEINLGILYGILILALSYQSKISKIYFIGFSVFASLAWAVVDYSTHTYSNSSFMVINWLSRLSFFVLTSVVAHLAYIEKEQRQIISIQKSDIEKANTKIKVANTALNNFIGMAAHDIRNPVGSIQMLSEFLLEKNNIDGENKKLIELIKTSATHSLEILHDTLDISQIQSGTIQLNITTDNYIAFIADSLFLNKEMAVRKNQTIRIDSSPDCVMVAFDKSRMRQVINNLVSNAVKYSAFGTEITVRVSHWKEEEGYLLTEVIDHGMGIEEKYHSGLFSPFAMTSNIPTNNESKSGLGLAIVKKIVELHNGQIHFTSEAGKGSNFYFTIPIKYVKEG